MIHQIIIFLTHSIKSSKVSSLLHMFYLHHMFHQFIIFFTCISASYHHVSPKYHLNIFTCFTKSSSSSLVLPNHHLLYMYFSKSSSHFTKVSSSSSSHVLPICKSSSSLMYFKQVIITFHQSIILASLHVSPNPDLLYTCY